MESPSLVDLSDENILGTLWTQLLLQFSTDCFETFQFIFSHFFCFVNLVCFWYEMLSKCIDSRYLVGAK